MIDVADSDPNFLCLSLCTQDCVTIDPPDTVLLRPPTLSLLPRLSIDKTLPQVGQHFQFSKVDVSSEWNLFTLARKHVCDVYCIIRFPPLGFYCHGNPGKVMEFASCSILT